MNHLFATRRCARFLLLWLSHLRFPWIQFIAPPAQLPPGHFSYLARATMLSQPLIRSTATRRKCSEYRLFATRSSFSAKSALFYCLILGICSTLIPGMAMPAVATGSKSRMFRRSPMNGLGCLRIFTSLLTF